MSSTTNGWTPERRARQAEMIRQWQPWQQSTGAKTAEGKAKSSRNAWKHGARSVEMRLIHASLRQSLAPQDSLLP